MSITNERAAEVLEWMSEHPRITFDRTMPVYLGEEDAALKAGAAALSEVERLRRELAELRKPVEVLPVEVEEQVEHAATRHPSLLRAAILKALNERGGVA